MDWYPSASYTMTDLATGKRSFHSGSELVEQGMAIEIEARPGATTITV